MPKHTWTKEDEILSLMLYFRRKERSSAEGCKKRHKVLEQRGIPASSINMKLGNYKSLDLGSGLENASLLSREVWKVYGTNRAALIEAARRITDSSLL